MPGRTYINHAYYDAYVAQAAAGANYAAFLVTLNEAGRWGLPAGPDYHPGYAAGLGIDVDTFYTDVATLLDASCRHDALQLPGESTILGPTWVASEWAGAYVHLTSLYTLAATLYSEFFAIGTRTDEAWQYGATDQEYDDAFEILTRTGLLTEAEDSAAGIVYIVSANGPQLDVGLAAVTVT